MSRAAVVGMMILSSWCLPYTAHAQNDELHITPTVVDSSEPVTLGLQTNKGHTTTKLHGDGGQALRINYSSTDTLQMYLVPLETNGEYNPTDFLYFTLPPVGEGQAVVDLTPGLGWSPGAKDYLVNIMAKDSSVQAGFSKVEFIPATPFATISAAFRQFFVPESYAPNSYHALRGYRVLGVQVSLVFGCLIVLAAAIALGRKRSVDGIRLAMGILTVGCLLYGARFALDLVQFTGQHLTEYYGQGVYDEAGAIVAIADAVKADPVSPKSVYMCRSGTNFREKLLRYFAYPIPVSNMAVAASGATLILQDGEINSSFSGGTLHCGDANTKAELVHTFQDQSALYRRLPAPR